LRLKLVIETIGKMADTGMRPAFWFCNVISHCIVITGVQVV